jgi:hypothetical protein
LYVSTIGAKTQIWGPFWVTWGDGPIVFTSGQVTNESLERMFGRLRRMW